MLNRVVHDVWFSLTLSGLLMSMATTGLAQGNAFVPDWVKDAVFYQIFPERGGSRLVFTGSQMVPGEGSASRRAALAKKIVKEDSAEWRIFAKAMAKDLGRRKEAVGLSKRLKAARR